jgi:hypothetical protein
MEGAIASDAPSGIALSGSEMVINFSFIIGALHPQHIPAQSS